jgi:hypothetical protein
MGLLNIFSRTTTLNLTRLPNGSFTVDPNGKILVSTLPHTFPDEWAQAIGKQIVQAFKSAQAAQLPLRELVAEYSSLKLTARAMRGGALIFLSPQGLGRK